MRSVIIAVLLATFATQQASSMTTSPTNSSETTNSDTTSTTTKITAAVPNSASSSPTTTVSTTVPSAATTKTSTATPPLGKLRPVSDDCLKRYMDCTATNAFYLAANFCQAFTEQKACINNTVNCTVEEVSRINYVDCGPNVLGADKTVGTLCQGRITECLSLSDKPENIKPATEFKTFFCAKRNEKCLITANAKAVCSAAEYKAAVKVAGCTAAQTVISSALFISLAVLTQRFLYSC